MAGAKILDRSTVQILVDDGRADVRAARDGRCIAELASDPPHDGGDHAFRLAVRFGRSVLGKHDRRNQRATPGPKILRGELATEIVANVLVELCAREIADASIRLVAEEARAARQLEQL